MVSRALVLSLLLGGCFPPPLDETGKRCAANRPCGDGFTCVDLRFCTANDRIDAGPDNWLVNPDFETLNDAGKNLAAWHAVNGDLRPEILLTHEGRYSARLYSIDGGETPSLLPNVPPVKETVLGQTWCAQAWARAEYAGDAGLNVGLFIRERYDDGGTNNESTPTRPKVFRDWLLLEESYVTQGADKMDLRISFTNALAKKGEAIVVDQVRLKHSADGVCRW